MDSFQYICTDEKKEEEEGRKRKITTQAPNNEPLNLNLKGERKKQNENPF